MPISSQTNHANHDDTLENEDTILVGNSRFLSSLQAAVGRSNVPVVVTQHDQVAATKGEHESLEAGAGATDAGGKESNDSIVVENDDVDAYLGYDPDGLTEASREDTTTHNDCDHEPGVESGEVFTEENSASAMNLGSDGAAVGEHGNESPCMSDSTASTLIPSALMWLKALVSTVSELPNLKRVNATALRIVIFSLSVVIFVNTLTKFQSSPSSTASSTLGTTATPKEHLQTFVSFERNRNDIVDIADVKTNGFKYYAQSACLMADTFDKATNALEIQLADLPASIRERLIYRALIPGVSQSSSMQDSSSDGEPLSTSSDDDEAPKVHQKAHSYMAYWSTVFRDGSYETCIVASGMEIGVAEDIVGYEEEEKMMVVGTRPCGCGSFGYWCTGTCPVYETVKTKKPVFKSYSLSLKNQEDLHRWLVKYAIDATEALVGKKSNDGLPDTPSSKPFHDNEDNDSSSHRT